MKILDVFLEKGKNKFFNKIKKLPKEFEWYLGIITDLKDESFIKEKCNIIEENSKNNIPTAKYCKLYFLCLIFYLCLFYYRLVL